MLNLTLVGTKELQLELDAMPTAVRSILRTKLHSLQIELKTHIRDKLSGQVLNVVTGALRRSITAAPLAEIGDTIVAEVFSSGDVKYAGIHEFGGKTAAHDIYPKDAQALHFMMGGNEIFAKVVHHPGSRMPERSFMRSGLADMATRILEEVQAGLGEGLAAA